MNPIAGPGAIAPSFWAPIPCPYGWRRGGVQGCSGEADRSGADHGHDRTGPGGRARSLRRGRRRRADRRGSVLGSRPHPRPGAVRDRSHPDLGRRDLGHGRLGRVGAGHVDVGHRDPLHGEQRARAPEPPHAGPGLGVAVERHGPPVHRGLGQRAPVHGPGVRSAGRHHLLLPDLLGWCPHGRPARLQPLALLHHPRSGNPGSTAPLTFDVVGDLGETNYSSGTGLRQLPQHRPGRHRLPHRQFRLPAGARFVVTAGRRGLLRRDRDQLRRPAADRLRGQRRLRALLLAPDRRPPHLRGGGQPRAERGQPAGVAGVDHRRQLVGRLRLRLVSPGPGRRGGDQHRAGRLVRHLHRQRAHLRVGRLVGGRRMSGRPTSTRSTTTSTGRPARPSTSG